MPARLIALEGIDQSGKRTQTLLLAKQLRKDRFRVDTISFPIYRSRTGRDIRAFLRGKLPYAPQAVHMMYSLNRWENFGLIKKHMDQSDFVIADRYTPSNLAYGVSKGLDPRWLRELDRGLPQPDLIIVLDVPVSASFKRKSEGRDAHESSTGFMLRVRRAYRSLARRYGWRVLDGTMTSERVQREVLQLVRERFGLPRSKPPRLTPRSQAPTPHIRFSPVRR